MSKHRNKNEDLSGIFKALSDPNRLAILEVIRGACGTGCEISEEQMGTCVSEIAERFELALSTVSHHLKELKHAGLIECRKRGQWVYCTVNPRALARIEQFARR